MKSKLFFIFALVCGASAISFPDDATSRISSGNLADFNNFPFSVSLQRAASATIQNIERGHRCGGVLITLQHVLTTASCVHDVVNGANVLINPSEYRIYGGSASLLQDTDQNRIRTIANFTVYPDYVAPPASVNNIAIITLVQPFLNTTVQPIPVPAVDYDPEDFTVCDIASWGSMNLTAGASYSLRYVRKYIYRQSVCESLYSDQPYLANIFPTMLCAASYDIVSAGCNGDYGAALVCNGNLTGILMQTNACAISSFPEVYTRVNNYTTWVKSITGGSSMLRPELTLFAVIAIAFAKFLGTK